MPILSVYDFVTDKDFIVNNNVEKQINSLVC